jgi:excisionase family DNA binding protein
MEATKSSASRPPVERFGYSIDETCEATNLSRSKVYELIKNKKLKALKVGARTIITPDAIRQMLAELEAA